MRFDLFVMWHDSLGPDFDPVIRFPSAQHYEVADRIKLNPSDDSVVEGTCGYRISISGTFRSSGGVAINSSAGVNCSFQYTQHL